MFTLFKSPLCINAFLHIEQANDFSPMWVLLCIFNQFSCVCPFMYLQTATFCKCLVTWLLSLVNHLVYLQFTTIPECLVTFGADKWLLCCEDPFMILQITTCFKCLVTIGAGKWLLSCVPFCVYSNCYFLQRTTKISVCVRHPFNTWYQKLELHPFCNPFM